MQIVVKYIMSILLCFTCAMTIAQVKPGQSAMEDELKYRSDKSCKEEKYYKKGILDSIYRKWNSKKQKLTEGYYVKGKRHGKWKEWLSVYQRHDYLLYTYEHGVLKKLYEYVGWLKGQDSIKRGEYFYVFKPDAENYTKHSISWNIKLGKGKKSERWTIVSNRETVYSKEKTWRWNGIPWLEEERKNLYDKNGKNLGAKKHGTWRLWNKDGTLQKETWYDMGQKLREKLYDHGKLTSDKKY